MRPGRRRRTPLSVLARARMDLSEVVEVLVIALVMAVVIYFALSEAFKTTVARAQLVELPAISTTLMTDFVVYRASHGDWPSSLDEAGARDPGQYNWSRRLESIDVGEGGTITATTSAENVVPQVAGQKLSYRPAELVGESGTPVVWVCASAQPPPGFELGGANNTTILGRYLPAACRDRTSE